MKKRLVEGLAISALLSLLLVTPVHAGTVTDATGVKVSVADSPRRIVTLAPSLGELAADLLGEEISRIVGVTDYTDYPTGLEKTKKVGSYARFNLETVVALKPDLVLSTTDGNPKDQVLRLRELGLPVVVVATGNFSQVQDSMRLVSRALGVPEKGERMVAQFRTGLERIREKMKGRSQPKIFLQVGEAPLITVGKGTFLNDALEAVGGANLYSDLSAYPKPTLEDVVSRNPDQIIVMALGKDIAPYQAMAKSWAQFPKMKAVKGGKVGVLQADALLRPSLRLLEGLSLLEKAIHDGK